MISVNNTYNWKCYSISFSKDLLQIIAVKPRIEYLKVIDTLPILIFIIIFRPRLNAKIQNIKLTQSFPNVQYLADNHN